MEVRLSRQVNLKETCKSGSLHCLTASTNFFKGLDIVRPLETFPGLPIVRIHETALVAIKLRQSPWVLSHLLVVGYDAVYSAIENHQPSGIAGNDLCEYPCGSAYLILSAFVGDEAIEYLLPNVLIWRSQGTGLLAFFDGGEAMPECILITWRSASAFDSAFAWNPCH